MSAKKHQSKKEIYNYPKVTWAAAVKSLGINFRIQIY